MELTPSRRRVLGCGAVGLAVGLAGCGTSPAATPTDHEWTPEPGSWPTVRYGPRNTSHNPHADVPRSDVEIVGRDELDVSGFDFLVVDGLVVTWGSGGIVAREPGADEAVWRADHQGVLAAGAAPVDGSDEWVLYYLEDPDDVDGSLLHGVEIPGGDEILEATVSSLSAAGGAWVLPTSSSVLVGSENGMEFRSIDPESGDEHWSNPGTYPALADGRMYSSGRNGVTAFAERDRVGKLFDTTYRTDWRSDVEYSDDVYAPAVTDDHVLVGSSGMWRADRSGTLNGYRRGDGEPLWEPREYGFVTTTPAVADGVAYLTASDFGKSGSRIYYQPSRHLAIDLAEDTVSWERETEWGIGALHPGPVMGGGDTVVACGSHWSRDGRTGGIRAFDAESGDVLWNVDTEQSISSVVPVDEAVYALAGSDSEASEGSELLRLR